MPELPEVEVIRLFFQKHLIGKSIKSLNILTPKSFIGNPKLVEGQKIISISRTGKQLSLTLSNNLVLLIHLKMTGQLIYINKKSTTALGHPILNFSVPNKSTRLIFYFSPLSQPKADPPMAEKKGSGEILYFNDQRKFGWIKVLSQDELIEFQKNLGIDILSSKFTPNYFYSQLRSSSRPVKLLLLDQSKFAGIGNIYACDALFLAKIHPQTPSKNISQAKAQRLRHFLKKIMQESISHGGSTAKDNKYLHPDQTPGSHQFHFRVYQREREPCLVCRTPIRKIKLGGRSTFFCPQCQKR